MATLPEGNSIGSFTQIVSLCVMDYIQIG